MSFTFGPIQKQWLQSLEQHPERQHKGSLGIKSDDGTYKACCLGELGLIAGVCEWQPSSETLITIGEHSTTVLMVVYEKVGLKNSTGTPQPEDINKALSILNDGDYTWPQIAAIVRANPEHFFSKSV